MYSRIKTRSQSSQAFALTLARPAFFPIFAGVSLRRRLSLLAFAVIILSAITYVLSVNVILLSGETLRDSRESLSLLQQDRAELAKRASQERSPVRLEAQSRAIGMVEVGDVRYVAGQDSLVFSR